MELRLKLDKKLMQNYLPQIQAIGVKYYIRWLWTIISTIPQIILNCQLHDTILSILLDKLDTRDIIETSGKLETAKKNVEDLQAQISTLQQQIKNDDTNIQLRKDLADAQQNLRSAEIDVDNLTIKLENYEKDIENYYYEGDTDRLYYNKNIFEHPELLNFWFDFLDTEGELQDFNVKNVGSRSKAINDNNVKSIYFRETPAVVFTDNLAKESQLSGYRYIQIPSELMDSMFSISAQGKSAKDRLDELIYQHGYCVESASITAIPIYYLEPNVRIYVYDGDTGIDGEYVVSKITLPLTYNGTMSLTATKAAENVL